MTSIKISRLLEDSDYDLRLQLVVGEKGLDKRISSSRIQKPGLALTGFTEHLHPERVQVFGNTEISYLETLPEARQQEVLATLLRSELACIVVTKNLEIPQTLIDACERADVTLMKTTLLSSTFIQQVQSFLDEALTASASLHGVLMDVFGVGILLLGKSGIGKSEIALDLVMRGHRLVADDIVDVTRRKPGTIEVAARNHLLKLQGHHSAREFAERLNRAIADGAMHRTLGEEVE